MVENCQNCDEIITGNFCSACGQKKYKRIDRKYLWDEIQYTLLHTNKGFIYSVKNILKNPGKTAREYINGNRVSHYKPILLVFVLSGISTFLSYKVLNLKEVMTTYFSQQKMNSDVIGDMMTFMSSYNSIIMLLLVPFFALTTKIAFRKWGNNYYEHVVMNAYILSFYTIVSLIFLYPIMFIFRHSPDNFYTVSQVSFLLIPLILIWFFKEFYKDKSLKSIIIRVFGVLALTFFGYVLFIIIVSIFFLLLHGPEYLLQMKPK